MKKVTATDTTLVCSTSIDVYEFLYVVDAHLILYTRTRLDNPSKKPPFREHLASAWKILQLAQVACDVQAVFMNMSPP